MPSWGRAGLVFSLVLGGAPLAVGQNQVIEFDGKGSYVELPVHIFDDLEAATIEAWVRFHEFRNESRVFDFGSMGASIYLTEHETTSGISFVFNNKRDSQPPEQRIDLGNVLRPNQWCHFAAVTSRSGMRLYINGVLVGTNAYPASFRSIRKPSQEVHNYLGRNNWRGFYRTEDIRGQMDEIRVWRTVRTIEEIRANLSRRLTGSENGLLGLWNFDDGTARDSSPAAQHGRMAGNAKCVPGNLPTFDELPRPAVLFGKITDTDGRPLQWASIGVEQDDAKIEERVSDEFGNYRTVLYSPSAACDVYTTHGRQGDWRLGLRLNPEEWRRLDFALRDASLLSGRVRTMDTNVFQAAVVVQAIRDRPPGQTPPPQATEARADRVAATQWTDANGRFEFVNLKPGFYHLRCHGNTRWIDYEGGTLLEVAPGQTQLGVNFRFPPLKKGIWKNYTLLDGLRNDDVHDLVFDGAGVLWLATWGGVQRFDGHQWKRYTKEDGLNDNHVNGLALDAAGALWFATESGVARLADNQWSQFSKTNGLPDDQVRAITVAPNGSIWIGTNRGVSRFDGKSWQTFDRQNGLDDEDVHCLLCDPTGMIWIGTSEGVSSYDGKSFRNLSTLDGPANSGVYAIHRDADGVMWFGAAGSVSRFDGRTFSNCTTNDGLLPGLVRSIHRDSSGALWFGLDKHAGANEGGVARWDGRRFVCLTKADGLAGSGVRSIRQTPEGAMWFATDAGVSRYDDVTFGNFTTQDGLPNNTVSQLAAFSDGAVWSWRIARGSDEFHWPESDLGDGISRYDGEWFRTFTTADGLTGNRVSAVCRNSDGLIWFTGQYGATCFDGTRFRAPVLGNVWGRDGGISIYREAAGRIWFGRHNGVSFSDGAQLENFSATNTLANQHVSAIHRDSAGRLWFATLHQGLWCDDGQEFSNFSTNHGLPSPRICSIDPAPDGTLWFRTGCGFASYDGKKFSAFTRAQGLLDDQVNALLVDPDGTVWAGTSGGGVTRWRGGQLTTFTATQDQLVHDKVNAIYRDAQGVHWFGTDGGVSRFNGSSWSSLDERDGLAGSRVNAIAQDATGAYWFATDDGLTRYRPNQLLPNKPALTLDTGEAVKTSGTPSVLAGRLARFAFHAVDLNSRPQSQKYRFQIVPGVVPAEALPDAWLPSKDTAQIEWTTNQAGPYTFAVQYIDRELRFSEPAIAALNIVPPWYRNAWIAAPSGAGLLALLGSSLFMGARYYAKRKESLRLREAMFIQEHHAREVLESKNAQLEAAKEAADQSKLEAERANKAKSLFLANMSHEIRTPMNAILGYAQILQNDSSLSRKQSQALQTIRKSGDHLLGLIDEILDLSKIEAGRMELSLADFDLHALLQDVSAMFELRSRHKNLDWRLQLLGEPETRVASTITTESQQPARNANPSNESSSHSGASAEPRHSSEPQPAPLSGDAATKKFTAPAPWDRGVWVRGDSPKLLQVIMNLLANAVKFTDTGMVTLKVTAQAGSRYDFEVIDTGRGIPAERQGDLFRPFGQTDQSISTDGAGLGLAISKQKLDLMGDTLQFESAPGEGSRFYFSMILPAAEPRVAPTAASAPERIRRLAPGFQIRALVVDDLPENRDVLCEMLSSIGCAVASAGSGGEALASVRAHRPDIVFMDIRLPDMDGFQATRGIQKELGSDACKIVSFSASAMDYERQAYLDAGFDDFLAKPLRAEKISETLSRLLKVEFEPVNGAREKSLTVTPPRAPTSPALFSELLMTLKQAAEESNATKVRICVESLEQMGMEGWRAAETLRPDLERYDFGAIRNRVLALESNPLARSLV